MKKGITRFGSLLCVLLTVCSMAGLCQTTGLVKEEGLKHINGTTLSYKVMGEGRPLIVLHGGPGLDHNYLLPQIGALALHYTLIFYDQRGSGMELRDVDPATLTVQTFVEDLEGMRKAFDLEKMDVLGHSWGGLLGLFYGLEYPENLNSLLLINTAGARSEFWDDLADNIRMNCTSQDSISLAQIRASDAYQQQEASAVEAFYKIFFKTYFKDPNDAVYLTTTLGEQTLRNRPTMYSSQLNYSMDDYNILEKLGRIECPTLILHSDADPIPLLYADEIHDVMPNSTFIILEDCGHFPYIESPEEFIGVVRDFLDGVPWYK